MRRIQKKSRIESMVLDEISLVRSGDDPLAKVVISKSDSYKNTNTKTAETSMSSIDNSEVKMSTDESQDNEIEVPEEVLSYIQELEEALAESLQLDDAEDADEVYEDELELVGKSDPSSLEAIIKSNPEIGLLLEEANDRAHLAEEIAKTERNIRIESDMISKAEALPHVGSVSYVSEVLKAAYSFDEDFGYDLEDTFTTLNNQLAQSELLTEVGKSSRGSSDPILSASKQIMKSNPALTAEQAEAEAYSQNPQLYINELKGL